MDGQPASTKGKGKKNVGKKPHGKVKVMKEAASKITRKGESEATARKEAGQALGGLPPNPDTKGGKAAREDQGTGSQPTPPPPTLGRECSA